MGDNGRPGCWVYVKHVHLSANDVMTQKLVTEIALDLLITVAVSYCTAGVASLAGLALSETIVGLYSHSVDSSLNEDGSADSYVYLKIYRKYQNPKILPLGITVIHIFPRFEDTTIYSAIMGHKGSSFKYNIHHKGEFTTPLPDDQVVGTLRLDKWIYSKNIPFDTTYVT